MSDPVTLAFVSLGASVIGGVTSAYGAYQQGQQAKAQAEYQAAVNNNNAIAAGYRAKDALARGKEAERQQRLKGRLLVGRMRASLASSGQVIDEGSAGDLTIDQAGINELDALNVRANAAREAHGYQTQASNFRSRASLNRLAGANAAASGKVRAAGTLLSSGGKVASQWYQFNQDGVL